MVDGLAVRQDGESDVDKDRASLGERVLNGGDARDRESGGRGFRQHSEDSQRADERGGQQESVEAPVAAQGRHRKRLRPEDVREDQEPSEADCAFLGENGDREENHHAGGLAPSDGRLPAVQEQRIGEEHEEGRKALGSAGDVAYGLGLQRMNEEQQGAQDCGPLSVRELPASPTEQPPQRQEDQHGVEHVDQEVDGVISGRTVAQNERLSQYVSINAGRIPEIHADTGSSRFQV